MNLFPRLVCWISAAFLFGSPGINAWAQSANAARKPGRQRDPSSLSSADRRQLANELALSVDAGDSYRTPQGRRTLRRLAGAFAVSQMGPGKPVTGDLTAQGRPLEGFTQTRSDGSRLSMLTAPARIRAEESQSTRRMAARLQQARAAAANRIVNPVFLDPKTGLRILITSDVIVRLKPGAAPEQVFRDNRQNVRSNWDSISEFIVTFPSATAEEIFAEIDQLMQNPAVEWAEPDFIGQVLRSFTPNDPYFTRQWHLENTGQSGGSAGADAKLSAAWDVVTGSSNIVIAVMDDGVQIDHPDLAANIFRNTSEIPGNGQDDDGNGIVDDYQGYNFVYNLSDPGPYEPDDNHGTAVAGIIAAAGNNGVGTVGAGFGCRILPVKVLEGQDSASVSGFARALRYVGGLNASGSSVWRGADVVNISLTFAQSLATDAALSDLATKGRNGRGCAVFVAAGNSASAWEPVIYDVPANGSYTLRWEYSKDTTDPSDGRYVGDDTTWLDSITYPDGSQETFEASSSLPGGWVTSGFSPWTVVKDGENGNRALLGWNGPASRSVRAGRLTHNQTNYLQCTKSLTPGRLVFWVWVSSELGYDFLDFYVNGSLEFSQSGVPILQQAVGYPANNANTIAVGSSTDFDYRSDYSQYGPALDFVAPSDGGAAAITSTDRTGGFGYNDGSTFNDAYTEEFGGTSAATPLAAGVAALTLSLNPYLTAGDVRTLLRGTADKIGGVGYDSSGRNSYYGSGRINANRAVAQARPNLVASVTAPAAFVTEGDLITYTILVSNSGLGRSGPVTLTNLLPANATFVSSVPSPNSRSGRRVTFSGAALAPGGSWSITLTLSNSVAGTNVLVAGANTDIAESLAGDNLATATTAVLAAPRIHFTDATVAEGNSGKTNVSLSIQLSQPSSRTVTVDFVTVTNSASSTDFTVARGRLTFLPGETNRTLQVSITGDARNETDETLSVVFSAAVNAVLEENVATVTILNDDAVPSLAAPDVLRKEGNAGAAKATFKLRLSAPSGRAVSVEFSTVAGTAQSGLDFQPTNGTVVFTPGKVTANVSVLVTGDRLLENNESFTLALANPVGATLERPAITCTIVNNDPLPKVYVNDASITEPATGTNDGAVMLRLSTPAEIPVTVTYATTNGTALAGTDYLSTNGAAVFAPGETNVLILVPLLADVLAETNEYFALRLIAATNAVIARSLAKISLVEGAASLFGDGSLARLRMVPRDTTFLALGAFEQGAFHLRFKSIAGQRYELEWRPSLDPSEVWQVVAEAGGVDGNGEIQTLSDPRAGQRPQGFYRIRSSSASEN